ncbi:DUF6155 family protein [Jeotgalibacillus terrae]|uniref:DUF6155 family protein n=1 Tax=Jeotgalibacillus terrae TaxID=587735 RepID=A0ABW5ZGP2_9BACL|nr:DUF6155 family protein [Jeotgalibacillus terrae]MBM7578535.1 hypothetical protein [Jeotgalibacillus terrae]
MPIKLTELKKELKSYDQKELISLISELYKLNPEVKNYLSAKFQGEEAVEVLFEEARKKIKNVFFPDRGFGKLSLTTAKKAISDFKRQTGDEDKTADLMIYYVELGTEFTAMYGDIDGAFYSSMASTFAQAVEIIDTSHERVASYEDRFQSILEEAAQVGWGYPDVLNEIYSDMEFRPEDE